MDSGWEIGDNIQHIELNEIEPSEVKFVKFAVGGAMGDGGGVEVYCLGEKEIKYYYGNYVYGDLNLNDFYSKMPDSLCKDTEDAFCRLDSRKWTVVPMGMGNDLYVDAWMYLLFTTKLREIESGHIYQTWHKGAELTLLDTLNKVPRSNHAYLYIPEADDFWGMLGNVKSREMCISPGCTTCGCMKYRRFLKAVGAETLSRILKDVTLDELKKQNNLDWHDALEIILLDFGREIAEGTQIIEEYDFVRDKYYDLRRVYHMKPYAAREEVIRILQNK